MAVSLVLYWKKFRDDNSGFDKQCAKLCPKLAAALQEGDRCIGAIAASKDAKSSKQALADGADARKTIKAMLDAVAPCVAAQKDKDMSSTFKTVSAMIAKELADF